MSTISPNDKLATLNVKKERLYSRLQITYDMIKSLPSQEKVFLARVQKLDETFSEYDQVILEMSELNLLVDEKDRINLSNACTAFEELYFNIIAAYNDLTSQKLPVIPQVKCNEGANKQDCEMKPKLPKIVIPPFKGNLENFPTFISLFNTLVHDTNMSDIVKFSHLKSLLEPPASNTINSIEFTAENYLLAYNKLLNRYSNKRIVAAYHFEKILHFQPFSNDNINNFRSFLDVLDDNFKAIKALNLPDLADFLMLHLGLNVLDKNTRRLFERQYSEDKIPTFDELCDFIKTQYRVADLCKESSNKTSKTQQGSSKKGHTFLSTSKNSQFSNQCKAKVQHNCPICQQPHAILSCPTFLNSDVKSRYELLKKHKRCFACAGSHVLNSCSSKGRCQHCNSSKHNTLLHVDKDKGPSAVVDSRPNSPCDNKPKEETTSALTVCAFSSNKPDLDEYVLLSTASAKIKSHLGHWVSCRILIDPGSQVNLITNSLAQRLALPRRKSRLSVAAAADTPLPSCVEVDCVISPSHSSLQYKLVAKILPTVVSQCPSVPISSAVRSKFSSLQLADPHFERPASVDLLVGAKLYSEILSDPPSLIKGEPSAVLTSFGWILFGTVPAQPMSTSCSAFTCVVGTSLQDEVRRFWETEEVNIPLPENPDHAYCEEHYNKTVKRDALGRYVVSLPFKRDLPKVLEPTREIALQRLYKLEARLERRPELRLDYHTQMQDYIEADHVQIASHPSNYVLTHHGVLKDSSTTQLRVVFNGSEHAPNSLSLNDLLHIGPVLQTDIGQLITNFRLYPIALACDVKQMFRCIRLNEGDREFVHFFWRFDTSQEVQEFELTTVPFGLRSSPFLAIRTLIQLFKDEGHKYPRAAKALKEIYMDNILSGASSEEDALEFYHQLVSLFSSGGFSLRKFSSSSSEVLSHIPEEHLEKPLSLDDNPTIKVLGLQWNPESDHLCYKVKIDNTVLTKRSILSIVARIFDINGYLSPVIFWLKYFIQRLWLLRIDWDDNLPSEMHQTCSSFISEIPLLTEVKIPRYVLCPHLTSSQIIAFADASDKGYGCVVYLRTENLEGLVETHIIRAKSKVAPLKVVSIPRLELNAALLLAKVLHSLQDFINRLDIQHKYCFSDSRNVLWWLQTPPHQLKTYIANRVVQIQEFTQHCSWNYISTKMNPADCVSRGLTPKQLLTHSLYWKGPPFLKLQPSEWPLGSPEPPEVIPELKSVTLLSTNQVNSTYQFFEKFSSLITLQRVMAYVLRIFSPRQKRDVIRGHLSPSSSSCIHPLTGNEMKNALLKYVYLTQQQYLSELISHLLKGRKLKGYFSKLNPFISSDGIVRVGGRLSNAPINYSAKHPILIPKNSHLAAIICDTYHLNTLHGGPLLVQSLIHRHYWIPSLRQLVRKRIFKCMSCFKSKAKPTAPLMSDLPSFRVTPTRAFQEVGIDYGGPFLLKEAKRRNARKSKAWIALFICMCTKAVHIELVTSLSTPAFFSTLDRFISRRGLPKRIFSDHGTNFVGAAKKLKEIYSFISSNTQDISDYLSKTQIEWQFIPPSAPHFGGIWEAAIKSAKYHLNSVLRDQALTYEELNTLLTKVESVLNSRPLCSISNSPCDNLDYLTPGHFLIGQPLLSIPDTPEIERLPLNTRWELLNRSYRHFWKRWSQEYLHTLSSRPKWTSPQPNISVGSLVLLRTKDTSPQQWILARVTELLPGPDGTVRVVRLKTANSSLVRPVHKIVPLPEGGGL